MGAKGSARKAAVNNYGQLKPKTALIGLINEKTCVSPPTRFTFSVKKAEFVVFPAEVEEINKPHADHFSQI